MSEHYMKVDGVEGDVRAPLRFFGWFKLVTITLDPKGPPQSPFASSAGNFKNTWVELEGTPQNKQLLAVFAHRLHIPEIRLVNVRQYLLELKHCFVARVPSPQSNVVFDIRCATATMRRGDNG